MIDRMVTMDCHREKRNLCMAWVDVKKAYDSVDHKWLFDAVLDFVSLNLRWSEPIYMRVGYVFESRFSAGMI